MKKTFTTLSIFVIITILGGFLSGCESTNSTLEKTHIMNNGCFITCKNNKTGNKAILSRNMNSTHKKDVNHNIIS